jgi:cob(I)alamin adenosyltransferase
MKIYTKTGDGGKTSLYEVIGEIDELNSRLGVACSLCENNYLYGRVLREVQCKLQDINSIIATIDKTGKKLPSITEVDVQTLEGRIDNYTSCTPKLKKFILPGVTRFDASLHMCRTQARKVERGLWHLHEESSVIQDEKGNEIDTGIVQVDPVIFRYINRLSDFFFAFSRYACHKTHSEDCFADDFV